jgi:DNA-binding NarL/FixJ family response regulator
MILIVENHQFVRGSLRRWLELEFPQQQVIATTSGEEAVAISQTQSPQVVLIDVRLPQMNGFKATQKIKAVSPDTQVIIFSLYEEEAIRTYALAAGASAYVPKRKLETDLLPALARLPSSGLELY